MQTRSAFPGRNARDVCCSRALIFLLDLKAASSLDDVNIVEEAQKE